MEKRFGRKRNETEAYISSLIDSAAVCHVGIATVSARRFVNPVGISRNPCVHAGLVLDAALQAETDDAVHVPPIASSAH